MVSEEWRDIKDYEGLYKISNRGNIISNKGNQIKQLKHSFNKFGYQITTLRKNNNPKVFYVHRLVAQAFIPNPDNKPCIDHINTDKTDNRVENLRWCTQKENCNNQTTIENYKNRIFFQSEKHPNSKPILQFSKDGEFIRKWNCAADVEREMNIYATNITACCKEIQKTAYGYKWGYVDDYERIPFKIFNLEIYRKKF